MNADAESSGAGIASHGAEPVTGAVQPVIALRDVSFDYFLRGAPLRVLSGIDLRIEAGEFVAIIGASGSGKSTLMNLMGLMASASEGEVAVEGETVAGLDGDALATLRNRKIGFIFQQFHLLPKLSVRENVLLPARYSPAGADAAAAEARADALLARLGLADQADKFPSQLSGGQKQRAAIARALVLDPAFLLADEPTGALDTANTQAVLGILRELNAQGSTVIVITHDPEVAAHARRVVRLHDGRIVGDERRDGASAKTMPLMPLGQRRALRGGSARERLRRGCAAAAASLRHSLDSLAANRVRSALTVLGLSIGISAIIIMLSLTQEARRAFAAFFDSAGARKAWVHQDWSDTTKKKETYWKGLRIDSELPRFSERFAGQGRIEARISASQCKVTTSLASKTLNIEGLTSVRHAADDGFKLERGRFFAPQEYVIGSGARPVLLGSEAAAALFPREDLGFLDDPDYPLGQHLSVRGCSFGGTLVVVGLLRTMDSTFDNNANLQLFAPVATLLAGGAETEARYFSTVPAPGVKSQGFGDAVAATLRLVNDDRYLFKAFSSERQLGLIDLMLNVLGGLTLAVGALCTCIGGIGVMNIMLVNITERIREIGLRKALGARAQQIRNQFLFESVILCLAAGVLGLAVGSLVSNAALFFAAKAFPAYLEYAFTWNHTAIVLALCTSVGAGIVFGLVPARRAARMDVVESLRQE